jgi:hypothetical protein
MCIYIKEITILKCRRGLISAGTQQSFQYEKGHVGDFKGIWKYSVSYTEWWA